VTLAQGAIGGIHPHHEVDVPSRPNSTHARTMCGCESHKPGHHPCFFIAEAWTSSLLIAYGALSATRCQGKYVSLSRPRQTLVPAIETIVAQLFAHVISHLQHLHGRTEFTVSTIRPQMRSHPSQVKLQGENINAFKRDHGYYTRSLTKNFNRQILKFVFGNLSVYFSLNN